jgi:lysophospholipase L1-like esterase
MLTGTGTVAAAAAAVAFTPAIASANTVQAPQSRRGTIDGWVGTWAAAAAAGVDGTGGGYPNYSIRCALHASIGGEAVRVRLSNAFGAEPVTMGHVTVAIATAVATPNAVPGTMRSLTFSGQQPVTIPPGADVFSDPAPLHVPAGANLLVTTYVPTPSGPVTYHPYAGQTSFFTNNGDHTTDVSGTAFNQTTEVWHYVNEVDVFAPEAAGSVVTFGDSITDGVGSTWDANHRWPDRLAARIATALPPQAQLGVLNAGISANRLLISNGGAGLNALTRIERDVLPKTSARSVIVLLGINDIQQTPHQLDPGQLIMAHQQIITAAHARGLRAIASPLTPFKGFTVWTPQLESVRQALNNWIRSSGHYDAVVDFDKAIQDPNNPLAMLPAYDSGDHLHPNDAGYVQMAGSIPLEIL